MDDLKNDNRKLNLEMFYSFATVYQIKKIKKTESKINARKSSILRHRKKRLNSCLKY